MLSSYLDRAPPHIPSAVTATKGLPFLSPSLSNLCVTVRDTCLPKVGKGVIGCTTTQILQQQTKPEAGVLDEPYSAKLSGVAIPARQAT